MTAPRLRGLYAITSAAICSDGLRLAKAVEAALTGGARIVQYRDKDGEASRRRANAEALLALCRHHGARLIVNDDVALAAAIGADGVHLGASDAPLAAARERLGAGSIIGVSCSNSLERARAAAAGGATYVAFGRFYPSRTKPEAPPASLDTLRRARAELALSICAIGGVTPENAEPLIRAGADMVAAVEGVFGATDPCAAARAYAQRFEIMAP